VSNQQLSEFRALVLDVSYRPIDTLPWTRAIVLDFFDKVDVLEYYDSFVRSARDYHYLPAVVRVKFYVKKLQGAFDRGVPLTRKNVYARDEHTCQYCGSQSNLTLDHVIPVSKGGGNTWENIVCACNKCNQTKGDKLLKQCKRLNMALKKQPKQPSHYDVNQYVFGVSTTGHQRSGKTTSHLSLDQKSD
jgi:5-methylcytosine-specific restriction endonuclease McrA